MNSDFVKNGDIEFGAQLQNFANKLDTHFATLFLTLQDVADAKTASDYFKFVLDQQLAHTERARNWTSFKNLLRKPGNGIPPATTAPETLVVPVPPPMAPLGIEAWFRGVAKRAKASAAYTDNIGKDLGIVAPESTLDLANKTPSLKIQLVGGQPLIIWKKEGMDGIEIWKDTGDGVWRLLKYDLRPNHLDNSPLPEAGTSSIWKYKAVYRYADEMVGNWSDEVSIAVTGQV